MQVVAASRADWMSQWRRLKGTGATVLELKVGGGPRVLAHVGRGVVTLLAMGDHEITTRYVRDGNVKADVGGSEPLPSAFVAGRRSSFFPHVSDDAPKALALWGPERTRDWLYFLDDEQATVCQGLVDWAEDVLAEDNSHTLQLVVGGPGTGKTSILLQLLKRLSDQVAANRESWRVGLAVSDRVAQYVTASTGWNLDVSRRLALDLDEADVLLVDDPSSAEEIARVGRAAQGPGRPTAVIVAFDPLQLRDSLSDVDYRRIVGEQNAGVWRLRNSYRQKEVVGRYALAVAATVAASSPFRDETKQRQYAKERRKLTNRANFLVFPNPSGHSATHLQATLAHWRRHVRWIRVQSPLWTHWKPLLVIVDDNTTLPTDWLRELDNLSVGYELLELSQLELIKGLEYQHVLLVLSAARHEALERGFTGSGRPLYNDYRLLRIPFTRAKDSIAVFVRDA